jgi:glyoxylase-like metal-dependent hydrolase (beta-lactamase superfamily II)
LQIAVINKYQNQLMQIIPLSEGTFTVDKTKHFVPFDDSKDDLLTRSSGSLLVEIQPFLIITDKDIILIDAGLGFSDNSGKMQILQNIKNAGINPGEVTKVLLSHLHKDHAGGVSLNSDHNSLAFPAATYYVREKELQFSYEKGLPSFITEELDTLKYSNNVVLLKDERGILDEYIYYQLTSAHSPYHQVFWIKENAEIIFFGGDDAPQLQQMKHRFVAKYDYNGKKAMELRKEWWEKGEKEKWKFLFYHDVKNPVWQF